MDYLEQNCKKNRIRRDERRNVQEINCCRLQSFIVNEISNLTQKMKY